MSAGDRKVRHVDVAAHMENEGGSFPLQWPPQPAPTTPPERFQLLALGFNVTAAQLLVSDGRQPVCVRPAQALCPLVYVDEAHAMAAECNPDVPGIMVPLPGGIGRLLIDGNHRAYKALREGRALVPVYVLTEAEAQGVCDTPDAWDRLASTPPGVAR